jgi:hypothetical protein
MTISLANVAIALSVIGVVLAAMRRVMQWLELVTKTTLLAMRRMNPNEPIPSWLADQYKKLNGNSKASRQEKIDLLGKENDSGEHTLASRQGKVR